MNRYARQIILPDIGAGGQARLAHAHVLVVGAGGLGVPVLQYLAGAGVGQITLVDGDMVAEHNLHRQPLYRMDQLGQPKAQAAADALAALNPDVQVTPCAEWLDPANAPAFVSAADVVLDCADTFAASLTLSDTCRDTGTPLITASALALDFSRSARTRSHLCHCGCDGAGGRRDRGATGANGAVGVAEAFPVATGPVDPL
jgi:molybdopterin/thiamine biosynthesis adenylyltransferase